MRADLSVWFACFERECERHPALLRLVQFLATENKRSGGLNSASPDVLVDLPDSPVTHCLRGEQAWSRKQYERSLADFRLAQKIWHNCPWVAVGAVRALLAAERVHDAWDELKGCASLMEHADRSCGANEYQGLPERDVHEVGLLDSPEYRQIAEMIVSRIGHELLGFGQAFECTRHWEASMRAYASASIWLGECDDALYGFARCARGAGRMDDAIETLRKIIAKNGGSACAYLNLGHCYLDTGRFDNAIETYTIVRNRWPEQEECGLYLAKAYCGLGEYETASLCLEGLELSQWPGIVNEYRGYILHAQGLYTAALEEFQIAMNVCSDSFEREDIMQAMEQCRARETRGRPRMALT